MGEQAVRYVFTERELFNFKTACIEYGSLVNQKAGGKTKPYRITGEIIDTQLDYIGQMVDAARQTVVEVD